MSRHRATTRPCLRAAHGHDTELVRAATRPAGACDTALGAAMTQPRPRDLGAAYARRLGCGCAHCALVQFLTQHYF